MRRSLPGDADYQPPHRPLSVFTCLSHCRLACFTSHGHEPPTSRSTSSGPAPCLPPSRALRAEPPPHAQGTGCAARPAVAPQPLPPSVAWRFTAKGWGGGHTAHGGGTRDSARRIATACRGLRGGEDLKPRPSSALVRSRGLLHKASSCPNCMS